jgi:O-antigen/teichoic acid export membrane protein
MAMEFNSHRALSNTAWSMLGYGWPIIFSIFVTPIVVSGLGIRAYGVYTFFNTVIGLLGLLDLGVSTAISKYLAEYHAQKDPEKVRRLLGTASIILTGIGIVGLLIFIVGTSFPIFSKAFVDVSTYRTSMIAAGLTFFLSSVTSIYTMSFSALQRFDLSSKVGVAVITFQQLTILILVLGGYSINAIFISQLVITFGSFIIQRTLAFKILPEFSATFRWDRKEAAKYYRFGLTTFINNISTSSLTYLDRLIIPFFLGPSNLTYYSLPGNVGSKIPSLSNSLSAILFPMASGLHGTGEMDKLRTLYIRSFRLITVVSAAATVTVIAYAYDILHYWISSDLADRSTTALIILALTSFVLALIGPLSNFLLGLGKLKFLTTFSISMAIINTILLLSLLPHGGINGAAWAYLLSLFPAIYMFYFTEKHYLNLTERRAHYRKTVLGNLLVGGIIYALATLVLSHLIINMASLLVVAAATGLLYLLLYWLFGLFEPEDVHSIKLFINRLWSKR